MIYNVGINDAGYVIRRCPFYAKWKSIIQRCYSGRPQYSAYAHCVICDDWLTFSNFRLWMEPQRWEGLEIDKDIVGDGSSYDPESCIFVPRWLNMLFCNQKTGGNGRNQNGLPLGVHYNRKRGKFVANISYYGKTKCVGWCDNAIDAHQAFKKARDTYVRERLVDYPDEHVRAYVFQKLDGEVDGDVET